MQLSIRKLAGALALGAASLGASSAAYADVTYDGVTFTTSWSGNELTVEIDAADRTGAGTGRIRAAAGRPGRAGHGGAPQASLRIAWSQPVRAGCNGWA